MSRSKNGDVDLPKLCADMGSRDADQRYEALLEAQALPEEQLAQVVRGIAHPPLSAYFPWRRGVKGAWGVLVIGSLICLAFSDRWAVPVAVGGLLPLYMILWDMFFLARNRQIDTLLRVLVNRSDSFCVEAALFLLGNTPSSFRDRLHTILLQRLPNLRVEDTLEWTDRQKEPIKSFLRFWYRNEALAYCVLQVLPEIGGAWALATVERLAKLKSGPISKRQRETWAFAQGVSARLQWEEERRDRSVWERFYSANRQYTAPALPPEMRWNETSGPQKADLDAEEGANAACRRIGEAAAECLVLLRAKIQAEAAALLLLRAAALGNGPADLLHTITERTTPGETATLLRAAPQEEALRTEKQ